MQTSKTAILHTGTILSRVSSGVSTLPIFRVKQSKTVVKFDLKLRAEASPTPITRLRIIEIRSFAA